MASNGENAKRALLVAIQYRRLSKQYPKLRLPGVDNDAGTIRDILIKAFGYKEEDIMLLTDDSDDEPEGNPHRPTQENIIREMRGLVKDAKPGDRFVFHFSGHGSQIENLDGTEKDGYDEVIWPEDVIITHPDHPEDHPNRYIIDDLIKKILIDPLPVDTHLTIIFDSCHSGTAADLPHYHSDHKSSLRHKPRRHPSVFAGVGNISEKHEHASGFEEVMKRREESHSRIMDRKTTTTTAVCASVISWSACNDFQLTYGGNLGGIFVNAFAKCLEKYAHNGYNVTHEDLLHDITEEIHSHSLFKVFTDTKLPFPQIASLESYKIVRNKPVVF